MWGRWLVAEEVGNDLIRKLEDGVLWITLNRPEAGNAMTTPMRDQIGDWMIEASGDPWVRCVVLTGAGEKGFCTGADIRSQRRDPPPKPEGAPERIVGDADRDRRAPEHGSGDGQACAPVTAHSRLTIS